MVDFFFWIALGLVLVCVIAIAYLSLYLHRYVAQQRARENRVIELLESIDRKTPERMP